MALVLRTADNRYQNFWDQHVIQAGYAPRTISPSDAEVALFAGEATPRKSSASVSTRTANNVIGELQLFYSWQCPANTRGRLINGSIFRMKLVNNAGTELGNDAQLIFLYKKPHMVWGLPFAFALYSPWKNITIENQRDITKNESCALIFEKGRDQVEPAFIQFEPGDEFQICYAASSVVIDPSHANFIVEFDMGVVSY